MKKSITEKEIRSRLFEMKDEKYKTFQSKLIPTVLPENIIGVRIPLLRKFANELMKSGSSDGFISLLPHRFYEENQLHSFIVCGITDFDECISKTNRFLPFVDNWAVCDSLRPKCFKDNKERLLSHAEEYISSSHPYTVRFGIEMLMVHFLDEKFDGIFLKKVSEIKSDDYYVNMMISWFFATALAKQYKSAVKYVENGQLPPFVHRKTIQKACESLCIPEENKQYLKTFRTDRYFLNK